MSLSIGFVRIRRGLGLGLNSIPASCPQLSLRLDQRAHHFARCSPQRRPPRLTSSDRMPRDGQPAQRASRLGRFGVDAASRVTHARCPAAAQLARACATTRVVTRSGRAARGSSRRSESKHREAHERVRITGARADRGQRRAAQQTTPLPLLSSRPRAARCAELHARSCSVRSCEGMTRAMRQRPGTRAGEERPQRGRARAARADIGSSIHGTPASAAPWTKR